MSYDRSLDLVLRQKSIQRLQLRDCAIATFFELSSEYIEDCDVDCDDWLFQASNPPELLGVEVETSLYHYSTEWDYFLDRLLIELSYLSEFVLAFDDNMRNHNPECACGTSSAPPSIQGYCFRCQHYVPRFMNKTFTPTLACIRAL